MDDPSEPADRISPDPLVSYREAIANRFVSLWDMLQLQTNTFLPALTLLASASADLKKTRDISSAGLSISATMSMEMRAQIVKAIEIIKTTAEVHELHTTLLNATRCYETCVDLLTVPGPIETKVMDRLVSSIEGLLHVVIDEAENRKFYALGPRADTQNTSAEAIFGSEVVDAFPSAAYDLEEAGRCMSFELWTAGVMHLMRALEPALDRLATHVGVAPSTNWNQTLDQIEKALRQVTRKTDGAEAEEWAAEAGTQLRFIKNAWRNSAMHGGVVYDERRARGIFETTRSLLQHLAEKISSD